MYCMENVAATAVKQLNGRFSRFEDKDDAIVAPTVKKYVCVRLLPVLARSAVAGAVVGVLVTLFNLLLELGSEFALLIGENLETAPAYIPLFVAGMLGIAVFMYFFTKKLPEGKGSGIPRTEAMMCGKKELVWWRLCIATVIGSFVSFLSGIPVGAEGPSVQFGGGLGAGIEEAGGGRNRFMRRYVGTSGIAAGVAGAFIAPCTGIIFAMEEVQRKFNPLMAAACCTSVIYAYEIRVLLGGALGMKSVFFAAESVAALPFDYLWVVLFIGLFAALSARLFNIAILKADSMSARSKTPAYVPLLILFAVVAAVNVLLPDNIGSGSVIISGIINMEYGWGEILVLFAVKFALVVMVFRAAPTGGMMVPMLAIGTMLGALTGFMCEAIGMPPSYVPVVALITMAAFFGSCIKAPITVFALFLETTHCFDAALPLALAVLVAYAVSVAMKQPALYDTLWERDLERTRLKNTFRG